MSRAGLRVSSRREWTLFASNRIKEKFELVDEKIRALQPIMYFKPSNRLNFDLGHKIKQLARYSGLGFGACNRIKCIDVYRISSLLAFVVVSHRCPNDRLV